MKGYKPYKGRKHGWEIVAALIGFLILAVAAIVLSTKAGAAHIEWNTERNRELLTMGCTYAELDRAERAESQTETELFKIYAYCPCEKCCGKSDGITATGTQAAAGRTIAVDPSVIPLGSTVVIEGHEYVAEDTGAGIKGKTIDLFMEDHEEALEWGVQYKEVIRK